jgi:hypothetical protein
MMETVKLEVAVRALGSFTVKAMVYTPSYVIDVGATSMSYAAGFVKIPPGILAGVFVPYAYVALIVNVSPLGSEK